MSGQTFARQVPLSSGTSIPQLGLGVFQVGPDEAQAVVEQALEVGYRHIDTAAAYVNESGVGAAIRASGLPREEVFVTSKLRNGDQGHDSTLRAYADTCSRLGLDRLDLYLIHWPNPAAGLWQDSWRAMASLAEAGEVAAVGVSNFLVEHLEELAGLTEVSPAVNQIEVHPTYAQRELRDYCRQRQIAVEAYSPLGQGTDLGHETITGIAERLGVTPAQVILRWHLDSGHIVIPKTVSTERMRSNADLDGVPLTTEDLAAIDALEAGLRTGNDPRTFAKSQIR
ncbi:aldo/keto reductase [Ruania alba]|uniref:Aldo/keto reductase n=1 Tax=Ruania alba TaxID=648782 RepID=A0A1H5LMU9_9MICO|nr:aldo/keto reductase [Ruania alba]SEE78376.1 Aldo/keto reductase [Ruania alba]